MPKRDDRKHMIDESFKKLLINLQNNMMRRGIVYLDDLNEILKVLVVKRECYIL
mgnify:CR=1 FL=1